eukprot:jgi/Psemu1/314620/fgenesh1_kg.1627_\
MVSMQQENSNLPRKLHFDRNSLKVLPCLLYSSMYPFDGDGPYRSSLELSGSHQNF